MSPEPQVYAEASSSSAVVQNWSLDDLGAHQRFSGDASFEAHANQLEAVIRKTYGIAVFGDSQKHVQVPPSLVSSHSTRAAIASNIDSHNRRSLPPSELTLNLLRLTHTEQQRLFFDIPIIDEDDFANLCQKVYFAVSPCPVSAWATVNVGLFYLIFDIDTKDYSSIGLSVSAREEYINQLTLNIHRACSQLLLSVESSFENCQAFSFLVRP